MVKTGQSVPAVILPEFDRSELILDFDKKPYYKARQRCPQNLIKNRPRNTEITEPRIPNLATKVKRECPVEKEHTEV